MSRSAPTFLHVDMDAFFASVEILERPELADKPVIVGGDGNRGVVASCNYQARRYGIRSAMPSMRAKALCPHAVFISGRYNDYVRYSELMHEILYSFTPLVESVSIDEAFLDVEGSQSLFGPPQEIATAIRNRLISELRLSASVGAATSKHLAKLASEAAKPKASRQGIEPGRGVFVVDPSTELDFLQSLPVRAIWGVGPVTARKLESMNLLTVGAIAAASLPALSAMVGERTARHLHDLAWNRDDRDVVPVRAAKSIGHEQTYSRDESDLGVLNERLWRLVDAVASRLRKNKVAGRTVTLKVRFGDFRTITRSFTLSAPTGSASLIAPPAKEVLAKLDLSPGVRLLGVSVSNLEELVEAEQLSLATDDEGDNDGNIVLDRTIDEIRSRYGSASVVPALLIKEGRANVLRPGERQWGPQRSDDNPGAGGSDRVKPKPGG